MRKWAIYATLGLTAACGSVAWAQTQRSGGGGELQKMMQQYQQLAAEKTGLQAQLAQQKKELDTAKADLAAAQKERDALKVRSSRSEGSSAALAQANSARQTAEQNLQEYKTRTNELVTRFRETATNLKQVELDRDKTRTDLSARSAAYDKCATNNAQLYEVSSEVLDRYEHVGPFTKVSAAEPFTRITRTRLENLADEYRARAAELKLKPPTAAAK